MSDTIIGGQFRLIEQVTGTSANEVWRGEDIRTGVAVACKLGREPDSARYVGEQLAVRRARVAARLQEECRLMELLQHARAPVRRVRGYFHQEGQPWLVWNWVEGRTLTQIVGAQTPGLACMRRFGIPVARAMAQLHTARAPEGEELGVIWRDCKPDNILISADGARLWLHDFGTARWRDPDEAWRQRLERAVDAERGLLIGTPRWLTPEQAQGSGRLEQGTDVFALGLLLYWLLTGMYAYTGKRPSEIHRQAAWMEGIREAIGHTRRICRPAGELLGSCFQEEPLARPAASSVADALANLALPTRS